MVKDRIGAIFFMVFSIICLIVLNDTKVLVENSRSLLFPKIALILILLLSILMFIRKDNIKKDKKHRNNPKYNIKYIVNTSILTLAYYYGITVVGYLLLTPLYLWLFSYVLGYRKKKILAITSIVTTIFIYILFIKILYIPLPMGSSFFKNLNEILIY